MLLLKYPSTPPQHPPRTFVDDALYLRNNLNPAGGAKLNEKYSERQLTPQQSLPVQTVSEDLISSHEQKVLRARSQFPLPSRFLQQQGGVEALFHGAARGVFERGEKLGINQAVRDAVGEVRRNMQGLQSPKLNSGSKRYPNRQPRPHGDLSEASLKGSLSALQARNQQLAQMLDKAMADLRAVSVSTDEEKEVYLKAMDLAISRVDFVRVYLEDASIPMPQATDQPATANQDDIPTATSPRSSEEQQPSPRPRNANSAQLAQEPPSDPLIARAETHKGEGHGTDPKEDKPRSSDGAAGYEENGDIPKDADVSESPESETRRVPVPTRSSIAQSSFAWMLEPDDSSSNARSGSSFPKPTAPARSSAKRSNVRREKTAFLFGEGEDSNTEGVGLPSAADADEGYNLGSIRGRTEQ